MLYDPSFWNDLLDRFLSCYSKVKVSKESLPLDKIDGVRSLLNSTLRESVNRNGFDPLRSRLKARVRDGKLTQRAYQVYYREDQEVLFLFSRKRRWPRDRRI